MKVTVMTLNKSSHQLDLQAESTILQVKDQISSLFPESPSPQLQKLIYAGKILKDEQTVESCGIREGEKLVLMITKPTVEKEKKIAAPARIEPLPITTAQPVQQHREQEPEPAAIQSIMELGFGRDEAVKALHAAFGNPDRAVEYLLSGSIPVIEDSMGAPGAEGLENILEDLRDSPDFLPSLQALQQNPELFNALLTQLGMRNPELMRSIQSNPQALLAGLQALIASSEPGENAATTSQGEEDSAAEDESELSPEAAAQLIQQQDRHNVVHVTPEENDAINRLCDLGFQKARAAEAYFVCDKNEEVAAEYLFEHMNDE